MDIRKRMWLYLILLVLALGTMWLLKPSTQGDDTDKAKSLLPRDYKEVKEEGILRVLAPYTVTQENTSTSGENVQSLINSLKKLSGLDIELRLEDNTHKALEMLLLGEVDLVLKPIAHTAELDSSLYIWLGQHVAEPIYLVQRKDTTQQIHKQLELENKVITLAHRSHLRLFLQHLTEEMGITMQIREDSLYNTEQLIMKVQAGSIDYTLCSGEEVKRYKDSFPSLDFTLPITHNLRRGWLTRRSSPQLADSLRYWLQSLNNKPNARQIHSPYTRTH